MLEEKWKTATDSALIHLIKKQDWYYVGKGQSCLVFQSPGLPFVLKLPFTAGNVDMGIKEAFQSNFLLRFITQHINSRSDSTFYIKLKQWAKSLIVRYSQNSAENEETPLEKGYSLWRNAFKNETDPCPTRKLTMDTQKLHFDFSKNPKGYEIGINMNALTHAKQNIILQKKVDLQQYELYSHVKALQEPGDLPSLKLLIDRLFTFQNHLFTQKNIMDVDLWVLGNYVYEKQSGIYPIDPGALRNTNHNFEEVFMFLSRNIERAEKMLTAKRLSKADRASDLYRFTRMMQTVNPVHGQAMSFYFLEQLIQYYQNWQSHLLGKDFTVISAKDKIDSAA